MFHPTQSTLLGTLFKRQLYLILGLKPPARSTLPTHQLPSAYCLQATNGSFARYQNQLCMGHFAGCVSRKLCGSVEGSEVVCHLKRWQKRKTRAVAAFSTLLVERAAPRARGNRKGWTEFKGEFVLWAQGELENLPGMHPEECYCGYFYFICVYLCLLGPVVKALPQPCQVSGSFMSGTSPTERCSQSSSGSSSSTLTGAE